MMDSSVEEPVVISGDPSPTLEALNRKGIQKLYELTDSLDAKSEPDLIRACIESLAKLNSSLRNNNVFASQESEEEQHQKAKSALVSDLLKKG